jgi:hypothetical protein
MKNFLSSISLHARAWVFAGTALLLCSSASGANFYEVTNGDISGDRFAPTTLTVEAGSNIVDGFFGKSPVPGVTDLDYFTVVVPEGMVVSSLFLGHLEVGGSTSFLGVAVGPIMPLSPTSTDPSPLLGFAHIYSLQTGRDLLPSLGINNGLAAGSYTFWSNETDGSDFHSYGYNFYAQPIPEPSTYAAVFGVIVLAIGALRRHLALVSAAS